MGQQAVYSELAKYGDCDNGWGMVEFANGNILTTHLGRTLTNGYEGATRVCGTKAHSVIGGNSTIDRVEIRDQHGVRTATTPDAFMLYDRSFINDLDEFAAAVLDGSPMSCTPEDAFEAAKIVNALQHSFRTRMPVYFDDEGVPIITEVISPAVKNIKSTSNGHTNGYANDVVNGKVNGAAIGKLGVH